MKKIISLVSSLVLTLAVSNASAGFFDKTGDYIEDSAITTGVKAELLKRQLVNDGDYNTWNIQVETNNGMVLLTGKVKTEEEKASATEAAQSVSGVSNVENDLAVIPE